MGGYENGNKIGLVRMEEGRHGGSHGKQEGERCRRHWRGAHADSTTAPGAAQGMVGGAAAGSRQVCRLGKGNPWCVCADGGPGRGGAAGGNDGGRGLRRCRYIKVTAADPQRKWRG